MEDLEFGVSVNPRFIPEEKEGISMDGWTKRFDYGLEKYDLRTREVLRCGPEDKFMLSGKYEDIKDFLKDVYGYVDYSCIYLWSAHTYDLIHLWKTSPRPDMNIWRCL